MFNTLERGTGVAVCPDTLIRDRLEKNRLVRLKWAPAPEETTLFMIRHADKWCSPTTARFIDIVKETITP